MNTRLVKIVGLLFVLSLVAGVILWKVYPSQPDNVIRIPTPYYNTRTQCSGPGGSNGYTYLTEKGVINVGGISNHGSYVDINTAVFKKYGPGEWFALVHSERIIAGCHYFSVVVSFEIPGVRANDILYKNNRVYEVSLYSHPTIQDAEKFFSRLDPSYERKPTLEVQIDDELPIQTIPQPSEGNLTMACGKSEFASIEYTIDGKEVVINTTWDEALINVLRAAKEEHGLGKWMGRVDTIPPVAGCHNFVVTMLPYEKDGELRFSALVEPFGSPEEAQQYTDEQNGNKQRLLFVEAE